MRRLILTTGDRIGVGAEIAAKALRELKLNTKQNVTVILHPEDEPYFSSQLGRSTPMYDDWEIASQTSEPGVQLLLDTSEPAVWVERAARFCLEDRFNGLVTGPLSKPGIQRAGLADVGHTDILRRITKSDELFMSFWGEKFNVVLVTGHIPISKVAKAWSQDRVARAGELTFNLLSALKGAETRPLAVVALNPHAGDRGLIGHEDAEMKPYRSAKYVGPLVPDTAFQPENWSKYSAYLCAYHDQGLIPFKMAHGFDDGVHVTLGLPFLRTSVDHGPAVELFRTGRARHGSMKAALKMALDFSTAKG